RQSWASTKVLKLPSFTNRGSSHVQRSSGVCPLERLRQSLIELLDERQDLISQVLHRGKVSPLDHPTHQDTEPDLDLIQPRRMLWYIDETDPMRLVLQKLPPCCHRFQNPLFPFHAEVFFKTTLLRHVADQRLRNVRRQIVQDEYPAGCCVARHRASDVFRKILLRSRGLHRRANHLTRRHLQVAYQTLRPVPFVLEFASLHLLERHQFRRRDPLE